MTVRRSGDVWGSATQIVLGAARGHLGGYGRGGMHAVQQAL